MPETPNQPTQLGNSPTEQPTDPTADSPTPPKRKEKRGRSVHLTLSDAEYDRVYSTAKKLGLSMSGLARMSLLDRVESIRRNVLQGE